MDIVQHYQITHRLASSGHYAYEEILDMAPYERDIFLMLLLEDKEREAAAIKNNQ